MTHRRTLTIDDLREMAHAIADGLHPVAEDRAAPDSYDYRIARAHALTLADFLEHLDARALMARAG